MEPTALKGTFLNFSGSSLRRPLAIRPSVISNLQFRRHVNNVALKSSYTVRASAFTPNPEPKVPDSIDYRFFRNLLNIQVKWMLKLGEFPELMKAQYPEYSQEDRDILKKTIFEFSENDMDEVNKLGANCHERVKNFLKKKCMNHTAISEALDQFFHFGCSSEEKIHLAYVLMLKDWIHEYNEIAPLMTGICNTSPNDKDMLDTTLEKELLYLADELKGKASCVGTPLTFGQFGSGVEVKCHNCAEELITSLGLKFDPNIEVAVDVKVRIISTKKVPQRSKILYPPTHTYHVIIYAIDLQDCICDLFDRISGFNALLIHIYTKISDYFYAVLMGTVKEGRINVREGTNAKLTLLFQEFEGSNVKLKLLELREKLEAPNISSQRGYTHEDISKILMKLYDILVVYEEILEMLKKPK